MVHNPIQKITFGRAAPGILVRDIQSACSFYSSALGFEKVFDNGTPVGFMVLKKDGAEIHLNQLAIIGRRPSKPMRAPVK